MEIFVANFEWMIPNLALACLGFVFALLYLKARCAFLRIPLFILWLLFLPNTIYLLTDIEHYVEQVMVVDFSGAILLTIQYAVLIILGFLTYFAGMAPVEKFFKTHGSKKDDYDYVFVIFNFAIAFAVILGKVERTHSWYVFTQPQRVIDDILSVLTTPILFIAVILFGLLFNLIYFGLRKKFRKIK